jgi:hypothetical protein
MFDKPVKPGEDMKPLYMKGHLDGVPIGRMMVEGGASVNILLLYMFEKLGHMDHDRK